MPVYAIVNPAPASGRTTTAIALAQILGSYGARVLLVDLDPNLDTSAAVGRARTVSVHHALQQGLPIDLCAGPSALPRVDLMPASAGAHYADALFAVGATAPSGLKELSTHYAYTILDCPASLGPATLGAISSAHAVLVPVPCEAEVLSELNRLQSAIRQAQSRPATYLFLTAAESDGPAVRRISASLQAYPGHLLKATIPLDDALSQVVDQGTLPTFQWPGVRAYGRLALELSSAAGHEEIRGTA